MNALPESVKFVLSTLEAAGCQAWCVGGCVRDLRLGRTPEDWDVTTDARPEDTLSLFGGQAIPTGLRHGTVTVRHGGDAVEVTTFRTDGVYLDHRRPEHVTFTPSLTEDLRRRDFTVNAMALDLRGSFFDPFDGAADLAAGCLRCVGEPDRRFGEDALRLMRGLRFAAVLGLSPEPDTAAALHKNRELLGKIAPERIWTELSKLLCGPWAAAVLRTYPDVLGVFWPEILPMVGFCQRNRHHCYDVWEHTLHALDAAPQDCVLRCVVLLHDVGKPACFTVDDQGTGHFYGHPAVSRDLADGMLRRLRVDTETRQTVVRLVEYHDRFIPPTERGLRRALRRLGETDLRRLIAVKRADNLGQAPEFWDRQGTLDAGEALLDRLLAEDVCFSLKQLAVNGKDLTEIGLQGPNVGKALKFLLDQVVDGAVPNQRERLLEALHQARAL